MQESIALCTVEGLNKFGVQDNGIQIAVEVKWKMGWCFLTCGVFRFFALLHFLIINWPFKCIWLFLCPTGLPYITLLLKKNLLFASDTVSLSSTVTYLGSQHFHSAHTGGRYKQLASFLVVRPVEIIAHRPMWEVLKDNVLEVAEVCQPNPTWLLVTVISSFYLCPVLTGLCICQDLDLSISWPTWQCIQQRTSILWFTNQCPITLLQTFPNSREANCCAWQFNWKTLQLFLFTCSQYC